MKCLNLDFCPSKYLSGYLESYYINLSTLLAEREVQTCSATLNEGIREGSNGVISGQSGTEESTVTSLRSAGRDNRQVEISAHYPFGLLGPSFH